MASPLLVALMTWLFWSILPAAARSSGRLLFKSQELDSVKPRLALSFQATLRTKTTEFSDIDGSGMERPVPGTDFEQEWALAVDAASSLVAAKSRPKKGSHWEGSYIDVAQNAHSVSQPFFGESVCWTFDYHTDEDFAQEVDTGSDFLDAIGDAAELPLSAYNLADQYEGSLDVGGEPCELWTSQHTSKLPLPERTLRESFLEPFEFPGQVQSLLRGEPKGSVILMGFDAVFCVSGREGPSNGHLQAANFSRTIHLQRAAGNSTNRTLMTDVLLRKKVIRLAVDDIRPLEKNVTALHPGSSAPGGHCINLTSGSVEGGQRKEMRRHVNDEARLVRINSEADGVWEAGPYSHWDGVPLAGVMTTLGTYLQPLRLPLRHAGQRCGHGRGLRLSHGCRLAVGSAPPVPPDTFDSREHWQECSSMKSIRNQGMCGSCWAVAAATVLADRFCVAAHGAANKTSVRGMSLLKVQQKKSQVSDAMGGAALTRFRSLHLSPQFMMDCNQDQDGCSGGFLDTAWSFLQKEGIPDEGCDPYIHCLDPKLPECEKPSEKPHPSPEQLQEPRSCPASCSSRSGGVGGDQPTRYRVGHVYAVSAPGDVTAMQQEILQHGPIEAAFFVFSDFYSYRKGTYFRTPSAVGPMGGHAVRMMGWGKESHFTRGLRLEYWLCANTFGRGWGMEGFFRIRRGTNECGIETTPAAGLPRLESEEEQKETGKERAHRVELENQSLHSWRWSPHGGAAVTSSEHSLGTAGLERQRAWRRRHRLSGEGWPALPQFGIYGPR